MCFVFFCRRAIYLINKGIWANAFNRQSVYVAEDFYDLYFCDSRGVLETANSKLTQFTNPHPLLQLAVVKHFSEDNTRCALVLIVVDKQRHRSKEEKHQQS